jgi:type II secretory ATPase GspE/PulE/Tfp pilus assembly ATPase PilB-like protein
MLNIPKVDAASFQVEPQALNRLSWSVALKHHVLPLGFDSGVLYVACATPLSRELDLDLSVIADCMVSLVWGEQSQIAQRLKLENHAPLTPQSARSANPDSQLDAEPPVPPDVHTLLNEALIEMKSGNELELVSAVNESSSVIKLVNQMIIDAYEQKASDIHIETNPGDAVSRVRFRKDGDSRN